MNRAKTVLKSQFLIPKHRNQLVLATIGFSTETAKPVKSFLSLAEWRLCKIPSGVNRDVLNVLWRAYVRTSQYGEV